MEKEYGWTIPIRVGTIKKGTYLVMMDHPCKVVSITICKTGKHGHAKAAITGLDIFSGSKYVVRASTSQNMEQPIIKNTNYTVSHIQDDDFVSLLSEDGLLKEDLKLPPDEVGERIKILLKKGIVIVNVLGSMGMEKIVSCKEG